MWGRPGVSTLFSQPPPIIPVWHWCGWIERVPGGAPGKRRSGNRDCGGPRPRESRGYTAATRSYAVEVGPQPPAAQEEEGRPIFNDGRQDERRHRHEAARGAGGTDTRRQVERRYADFVALHLQLMEARRPLPMGRHS